MRFGDPECRGRGAPPHHRPRRAVPRGGGGRAAARHRSSPTTRASPSCSRARAIPAHPRTGDVIDGLDDAARVDGVDRVPRGHGPRDGDEMVTAGGRVLDGERAGRDDRRRPASARLRGRRPDHVAGHAVPPRHRGRGRRHDDVDALQEADGLLLDAVHLGQRACGGWPLARTPPATSAHSTQRRGCAFVTGGTRQSAHQRRSQS